MSGTIGEVFCHPQQSLPCCQHDRSLNSSNRKPHSSPSDLSTASALLLRHPSSSLPSALSLSPCRANRPGNEGPLCPACPVSHGAVGPSWTRARPASAHFAHYSHYLASNQRGTGCWELSATHKGLGSLEGLPASALIKKFERKRWMRDTRTGLKVPGGVLQCDSFGTLQEPLQKLGTSELVFLPCS